MKINYFVLVFVLYSFKLVEFYFIFFQFHHIFRLSVQKTTKNTKNSLNS